MGGKKSQNKRKMKGWRKYKVKVNVRECVIVKWEINKEKNN